MQDPLLKPDEIKCHRTAMKKLCKDCRDTCGLWIKMRRKDPRTDAVIDEWLCGDTWQVILAAELVREMQGVHAALNDFRNETVKRSDGVLHLAAEMMLAKTALPPDGGKIEVIPPQANSNHGVSE